MKYILTLLISITLLISPVNAEISQEHKQKIDSFISKYENSLWVLTRVQSRLWEFEVSAYWEEISEVLTYFNSEIENRIIILEEKNSSEIIIETPAITEVKALYYSAYATSRDSKIDEIIDIAKDTEVNALIIDIKEIDGRTSFSFAPEAFGDIKPSSNNRIPDISAVLKRLKDNNIYTIARIVVFKDTYLANKRPDLAIKWSWDTNKVWGDYKWNAYTDPGSQAVWDYHIEMASASYNLGFDEINFDYVRFPSDGYISQTYYPKSNTIISENPKWGKMMMMDKFSEYINRKLKQLHPNIIVSADVFGLVTNTNLFQIGQNLESYALYFDYVAPMIYPSHYASWYLGHSVPDNAPYAIFYDSMKKAKSEIDDLNKRVAEAQSGTGELLIQWVFKTSAPKESLKKVDYNTVRPWLQGFSCSWCAWATAYNSYKFRRQIQAIEDLWFTSGWYVWNSSARYTKSWYK